MWNFSLAPIAARAHRIENRPVGGARMNAACAARLGVPLVPISGDDATCAALAPAIPGLRTVPVKWSHAEEASLSLHPANPQAAIHDSIRTLFATDASYLPAPMVRLAAPLRLTIAFAHCVHVGHAEDILGTERVGAYEVRFKHSEFREVFRAHHAMAVLSTLSAP